jgi:hypothetical protein
MRIIDMGRSLDDVALALLLAIGSANTWRRDLHPASYVPCPAHTSLLRRGLQAVASRRLILFLSFKRFICIFG